MEKDMMISLIVAMNLNRVIGIDGDLPWRLPKDLSHFKKMTLGKPVIMGRKTFVSLGSRPLKNRMNLVITSQDDFQCEGCYKASSLQDAIEKAKSYSGDEIVVIGGARLYEETVPIADKMYITVVENHMDGDVFFPYDLTALMKKGWKVSEKEKHSKDDRHKDAYTFYQLTR